MWYQEEARNRKHPPWVLLQSDEQQQKQHWLSAERQKEHLTTWVRIIFSCHISSMTIKRCSLQLLYVATSTQVSKRIQDAPYDLETWVDDAPPVFYGEITHWHSG